MTEKTSQASSNVVAEAGKPKESGPSALSIALDKQKAARLQLLRAFGQVESLKGLIALSGVESLKGLIKDLIALNGVKSLKELLFLKNEEVRSLDILLAVNGAESLEELLLDFDGVESLEFRS